MSTRRRLWLAVAALAVIVLAAGAGAWWLLREKPPRPPDVDLSDADPAVALLIRSAREDVVAEPRSGRRWGRLGMALRAHDYGAEANACFEQAERLDPREPRWPYYRGLTLVLTDPQEGLACLRRAVERMDDGEIMPRFRLVEVLLEQGQLDEAGRVLDRVAARVPDHPRGRLLRARLALARQDGTGAVDALEGCWYDEHTRRQAQRLAAEAWQGMGDRARAAKHQARAAELPEDLPWSDPLVEEVERLVVGLRARLALAGALTHARRTDEALGVLEQLAVEQPREVRVWVQLGQTQQQRGDAAAAERAFARAIEVDRGDVDAWFGLGVARLARPRQAADAFREAARLKPDHTRAHYLLGVCLKGCGDRQGARSAWRQALRCQPDHAPSREALAELGREAEK